MQGADCKAEYFRLAGKTCSARLPPLYISAPPFKPAPAGIRKRGSRASETLRSLLFPSFLGKSTGLWRAGSALHDPAGGGLSLPFKLAAPAPAGYAAGPKKRPLWRIWL